MRPYLLLIPACLFCADPALADELPTRKAGLWEITIEFEGRQMPVRSIKQCTDAAAEKELMGNLGGGVVACSERHVTNSGSTVTMDSVCDIAGAKVTSHAVITGRFDSAYTVKVTSKREGGRALPHDPPGGVSHMTMEGKWLGPCAKDQRPGDVIMPGGFKMNVLDMSVTKGARPRR